MKVWANIKTGKVAGYQYDFPNGLGSGFALIDQHEPATVEGTAVEVKDEPADMNRLALEEAYAEKHGKRPHPAIKIDKLKAAVS